MAIRDKDFMMQIIKNHIGDKTDDESLNTLADFTDTLDDMEKKAAEGAGDWEKKYKELDAEWRQKYKDRFFNNDVQNQGDKTTHTPEPEVPKKREYSELFSDGSKDTKKEE